MKTSKLLEYWQNPNTLVFVLGLSIVSCIGLYMAMPTVVAYLQPGSYGPINPSKLCEILQRGGKEIDCEVLMRTDYMLEEAFPSETTTRDEVKDILGEYWVDTFSITKKGDILVIDAYATNTKFLSEPDQAFFSFSQDGLLQQITYHSG